MIIFLFKKEQPDFVFSKVTDIKQKKGLNFSLSCKNKQKKHNCNDTEIKKDQNLRAENVIYNIHGD